MPQKLKTYVTTSGFFELAVAAPSMKAAIAIWGASPDLFQRGYAKLSEDAAVVRATMTKPGTVLKRAVGSRGPFRENPALPDLAGREVAKPRSPAKPTPPPKSDAAARLYEAAQQKREREKARAEARETKRREQLVRKAQAALAQAQDRHDQRMAAIDEQREALERRASLESERWEDERRNLEAALRKARD